MKSAILLALMLIAILFAANSEAQALRVFQKDGSLGVQALDLKLPIEALQKSSKSGLSTSFLAILSLFDKEKLLQSQRWFIKYHYDLWDENFILQMKPPNPTAKIFESIYKNENELFAGLAKIKFSALWPKQSISPQLQIKLQLILDPIDKEKAHEIRKWISQAIVPNSASKPAIVNNPSSNSAARGVESLSSTTTPLHFSGLFQKILDHDSSENRTQGLWSTELASGLILLKDVPIEE